MPRRWIVDNRRWSAALGVVLAVALGLAAFIVTRELAADGPTQAQPAEQPTPEPGTTATPAPGVEEPPGPDVTPEPGATPDTSKPYWMIPYQNAERLAPKYNVTVAGVELGPTVTRQLVECPGEITTTADLAAAAGSDVKLDPEALPGGAVIGGLVEVVLCDGAPISAWADYSIPADPAALDLVRSGEKTWFEVQHGGRFSVGRVRAEPAWEDLTIPTERWHEISVNGHPAAAAGPTIPEGFGASAVYVHVDGVLTIIQAQHLTLAEVTAIAEGLVR